MPKKFELHEDDRKLFRDTVRQIQPLVHSKVLPATPSKSHSPKPALEKNSTSFPFSEHEFLPSATSETILEFAIPSVSHKILRKLRRGQYNVEAILDLHGKTIEQAREAVSDFLSTCLRKKVQHVLIIHGKGRGQLKPILKNKLNHWLRETDKVLAFHSATPKDGHGGALYVLLRR